MLQNYLQNFKVNEVPESAVLIMDDPEAKRLLAYWPYDTTRWKEPTSVAPMPEDPDMWAWLWCATRFDYDNLSQASGIPRNIIEAKLRLLIAARLIYPDHTISSWAQKILRAEVVKRYSEPKR